MDKTVSKKGTALLGGMTIIGSLAMNDNPNLVVIVALSIVLTVYICVQGYLDWLGKSKEPPTTPSMPGTELRNWSKCHRCEAGVLVEMPGTIPYGWVSKNDLMYCDLCKGRALKGSQE